MTKGMAYPGFFYIDARGVIREKYFTAKYTDRLTAQQSHRQAFSGVECGSEPGRRSAPSWPTLAQSDRSVIPGGRVSLIADIELPPDVHVYSPVVQGCKPIQLALQDPAGVELQPVA
jgi:hypothetical protein